MKVYKSVVIGLLFSLIHLSTASEFNRPSERQQAVTQPSEMIEILEKSGLDLKEKGKYQEAEILSRRALELREQTFPPGHPDIAIGLNHLGLILYELGHYAEAEQLLRRGLEIREEKLPPDSTEIAVSLSGLAKILIGKGNFDEAEYLANRSLAILEKLQKPNGLEAAIALDNMADLMEWKRQLEQTVILYKKALKIRENILGAKHPIVGTTLANLALVLSDQGHLEEAESYARRALDIHEMSLPADHPEISYSTNILGIVLTRQNRLKESEDLFRKSLEICQKSLPKEHPCVARGLNNIGDTLREEGQLKEAEEFSLKSLALKERILSADHPITAITLNNIAEILYDQDRLEEAKQFSKRALSIREKMGSVHPSLARSLNTYAEILIKQNRLAEAEPILHRSLAINKNFDLPFLELKYNHNLGHLLVKEARFQEAVKYYEAATKILDRLFAQTQGLSEETRHTFLGQFANVYREYLELLLRLHAQDAKDGYDRKLLAVASRNQSRIFSELLRQSDVKHFSNDLGFIKLRDHRLNMLNQLADLRKQQSTLPIAGSDIEMRKAALNQQIDVLTADLGQVEAQLKRDYPHYLELIQPAPVTVEQLQQDLLRPDEIVLSFVLLPEKTVLLAVSRDHFTLQTTPIGRETLTQRIHALRNSLRLDDQGGITTLLRLDPEELHSLYRDLITPLEPLLGEGKRLLVVADGPLYSLPLELLVTHYSEGERDNFIKTRRRADGTADHPLLGEYTALDYLGHRYQFHYLPSLAALVAQRRCHPVVDAPIPTNCPNPDATTRRPLIAFADPVFNIDLGTASTNAAPAYSATTDQTLALLARSGALDGALPPLPQTAEEARNLASLTQSLQPPYLGEQAQEATVKQLSRDGAFKGLRYLLFATHGLLGGELLASTGSAGDNRSQAISPRHQSALALTLLGDLHGEDGLLTFREVLEDLRLDVDLAILSACNTAGDSAKTTTGEGFAGLTRAFLYAGARHLWVSHWAIETTASRDLMTQAVQLRESGTTDPAAALAKAQKALRASVVTAGEDLQGQPLHLARAHPYFWAPFVTVGD